MSTSVRECERGIRDWGEPERMPKSGLYGICLVKWTPSTANVLSLKYRLQTDSIWLFTKRSPHKQMLFAAPRLHIHINISPISACLIWHSRTDVDIALLTCNINVLLSINYHRTRIWTFQGCHTQNFGYAILSVFLPYFWALVKLSFETPLT